MPTLLQPWVNDLTYMQQGVLVSAVRAPDGLRKEHPIKLLMRWYRRSILVMAFEKTIYLDPSELGGGSFTGPVPASDFRTIRENYLRHVDEMSHHFQLHMMHAAEILGYKHTHLSTRQWWSEFYLAIVCDAHLRPETEHDMDIRLGDKYADWRASEVVVARHDAVG